MYEDDLNDATVIRTEINSVLFTKYRDLKKCFERIFESSKFGAADFKRLVDLYYYLGGWPSETTKPRVESLAKNVATVLKLQELSGNPTLEMHLNALGIQIKIADPIDGTLKLNVDEIANLRLLGTECDGTIAGSVKSLTSLALKLQKEICEKADEIKLEIGSKVKAENGILVPHFVRAVSISAKRSVEKAKKSVEKISDEIESLEKAIDTFKK